MKMFFKIALIILAVIIITAAITGIYQRIKGLPTGISVAGNTYNTNDVKFIYDVTYQQGDKRIMEQTLMKEALQLIEDAEDFIMVDLFLYNDDYDRDKGMYPPSAEQFTQALLDKRASNPTMPITVITDAVNITYGANKNTYFDELEKNNVTVIITNLKPLRDSNPIYSSVWRPFLQWWQPSEKGFLPNPFNLDGGKMSVGSYLDLLNFKANHRKIIMNESRALLTSANLTHDGSSAHSNIGFILQGGILAELYAAEQAVAALSGVALSDVTFKNVVDEGELEVKLITEGKIKVAMLEVLAQADEETTVKIGVFYISDRDIVKAIKSAAKRGATIQMILDPNKDAFGLEKNGIPNRQVAAELMKEETVQVRWYDTNGEQYHSKFMMIEKGAEAVLIGGSANFTRRNLADFNLENNLQVKMPITHQLYEEFSTYYERLWSNEEGTYTADFEKYEDHSKWKIFLYRLQEWAGLSTF